MTHWNSDMSSAAISIDVLGPQATPTGIAATSPTWVWEDEYLKAQSGDRCPVWGDVVPYKSVTVIVPAGMLAPAIYSLEYVHGGESVSRQKLFPDGTLALRSDYQCW